MKKIIGKILIYTLLSGILFPLALWSGTTGKIAGIIVDGQSGEPLPGVNVLVQGTLLGASTDLDGHYTILQVPPGVYAIEVKIIGFKRIVTEDVRVLIDQTARLDFELEEEILETDVVTIIAERNPVKPDVATSVVAVSSEEIRELPVANIQAIVGMQAGIQGGLRIRAGGADEALFLMDGVTLRDPRNNKPVSSLALSAVDEISIERGGFNAEYGQVRSGIINVVTKEGSKKEYYGNFEGKMMPPKEKWYDISPFDKDSPWLTPYFNDEVAWDGIENSDWSDYKKQQYDNSFEGWNNISAALLADDDPDNDLSPTEAQKVFMWQTRKQPKYDQPDYDIDAGFGGPVPFAEKLGNLRFFTTYRKHREMLIVPLSRDEYMDYDWTLKLTSDLSPSMKLMITGLTGKQYTMQQNTSSNYLRSHNDIAYQLRGSPRNLYYLYGTGGHSITDIGHNSISAKLTHQLSSTSFYDVSIEYFKRDYYSRPIRDRNPEKVYEIVPGYFVDESPFGYDNTAGNGIDQDMPFGGFSSMQRDNTTASSTTIKLDYSNQFNFNNLFKGGIEFVYNDIDFDYGISDYFTNNSFRSKIKYQASPIRAAVYIQDKLEADGFIMNIGLRLDYSNPNTDWINPDSWDREFFSSNYKGDEGYDVTKAKSQYQLSPRLGIAHPVTENSKLFFNYGHFKQMPSYNEQFRIDRWDNHTMNVYGDPNLTLAKTISYELGYDHALFNDYLIQVSAFYRDITDQQSTVRYFPIRTNDYERTASNNYQDTRGFELTLRKNRGQWWTFFGNYTYSVTSSGYFHSEEIYEDLARQRTYTDNTSNNYQDKPKPQPYARFNLSLFTPDNYGPEWFGLYPLGGFLANTMLSWQSGYWRTYNTSSDDDIVNNVQTPDYFGIDFRLSKTVAIGNFDIQLYMDIFNLTNYKRLSLNSFGLHAFDQISYEESLHLPESEAYTNIPGDDRYGDYRKPGVEFQPIKAVGSIESQRPEDGLVYYDRSTEKFMEYVNGAWQQVPSSKLDKILDDKAYIDMPNLKSFWFTGLRRTFFGIRVSFNF